MRDRNLQIEDGVFVFLAGTDSDLFELDDRSDLRFGVLVLGEPARTAALFQR